VSRAQPARPTDAPPAAHREPSAEGPDDASQAGLRPTHVAIIMDGNRRWARAHGVPELEGHAAGVDKIRWLVEHAIRRGIAVLSLYAFSRENWARSDAEVAGLFALLDQAIRAETPELIRQGVRVRVSGRLAEVPADVRDSITDALAATEGGTRLTLNIAFNYAGRTEIVDAVRAIVAAGTPAHEIDEDTLAAHLYTTGLPDPDLVIRTGGEQRLSNFLIWQSAYAEFHTCAALWPDFDATSFDTALEEFAGRGRRFGR
jgi:undecaprenyl diphosphate synthase